MNVTVGSVRHMGGGGQVVIIMDSVTVNIFVQLSFQQLRKTRFNVK